jgi:hypothetical protein
VFAIRREIVIWKKGEQLRTVSRYIEKSRRSNNNKGPPSGSKQDVIRSKAHKAIARNEAKKRIGASDTRRCEKLTAASAYFGAHGTQSLVKREEEREREREREREGMRVGG